MPIEKNGACKHMRCGGHSGWQDKVKRNIACGCEFCWVCEVEYVDGRHSCVALPAAAAAGGEVATVNGVPARFKHHFTR